MTGISIVISRLTRTVSSSTRAFFQFSQSSFALLGLALAFSIIALSARPELRDAGETWLMGWLQERQFGSIGIVGDLAATERATALDVQQLPPEQARVAHWVSKKYRVAPDAVGALVAEAYDLGKRHRLEPTLILAIAAIESGFNPFSQSAQGAQGLMQVMTSVHSEKFLHFGGRQAAFDPIANLRVGVKVLLDCIASAGSLQGGLRSYVGAGTEDDGGYADKVLAEQARMEQVARSTPMVALPAPAKFIPRG